MLTGFLKSSRLADMGFLSRAQLEAMNFRRVGKGALLSDRASFYGCDNIEIGDHVRIDDFCCLSSGLKGIKIGNHVHVAVYSSIIGGGRIRIDDFANISSRVSIYGSNDDYSGTWMTNPTVPDEFTGVTRLDVHIGRHVIVGSGAVILPGARLDEGSAVGALSLVRGVCEAFTTYAGVPARVIGTRSRRLLTLEQAFRVRSED